MKRHLAVFFVLNKFIPMSYDKSKNMYIYAQVWG